VDKKLFVKIEETLRAKHLEGAWRRGAKASASLASP